MTTPVGFLSRLCDGFAQLLAAGGLGLSYSPSGVYTSGQTAVTIMSVPSNPPRLVVLTPYGEVDDPTLSNSSLGLQVRTRSAANDPRDVFALDDAIADFLLGRYPLTLPNDIRVRTLVRTSTVSLGQDDANRWGWSSNYQLKVYRPGPHRL